MKALFTRVTSYYKLFIIIFIPEVIASMKDKNEKIIGILLVILLTSVQYYIGLRKDLSSIVPYELFWN